MNQRGVGEEFVTRKITMAVAKIKKGMQDALELGNLDAKRDWGYSKDYVEAMWLMLQQEKPDDYVISTGETHSVREFVELAFRATDMEIEWHGQGENEYGVLNGTERQVVKVNPKFYRPAEVELLIGDCEKARKVLGWKRKVNYQELVKLMVENDLKLLER